jgi:hypothetical protein
VAVPAWGRIDAGPIQSARPGPGRPRGRRPARRGLGACRGPGRAGEYPCPGGGAFQATEGEMETPKRACPECGSESYSFRSRKQIEATMGKGPELETKFRCKDCEAEWGLSHAESMVG